MKMKIGFGGWVEMEDIGLPALLYVRFVDAGDRLSISEVYVDARGQTVEGSLIRHLPFDLIEAFANDWRNEIVSHMDYPSADLSTLATYYGSTFGMMWEQIARGDWVVSSFLAQYLPPGTNSETDPQTGASVMRVRRSPSSKSPNVEAEVDKNFRLQEGPTSGLSDDFLRDVARAYRAAVLRGERPNVEIERQTGYNRRTVERWVYTARQRGIMPKGKKGKAS